MKTHFSGSMALALAALLLLAITACGPKTDKASASVTEESGDEAMEQPERVTYAGKPISPLLGGSRNDVIKSMGAPLGTCGTEPPHRLSYDGIHFWFDDDACVRAEVFTLSVLKIGETALDKNRAELIALFGNPAKEFWGDDAGAGPEGMYTMVYVFDCILFIYFADLNIAPVGIDVQKIVR